MDSFASGSSYAIDPDEGLVLSRMFGAVTGDEMLAMVEAVLDDPAWSPSFDVIWDCSDVTAHIVLPSHVTPIIEEAGEVAGRMVLVESPSVGGSLIAELLAIRTRLRGGDVTVTGTLEEAVASLGRDALPMPLRSFLDDTAG